MSIITKIDSTPLFTTKAQALKWARLNGLSGYHEHTYFGKKGYMAGRTHSQLSRANTFAVKTIADMSNVKIEQGIYRTDNVVIEETEIPLEQIIPQQSYSPSTSTGSGSSDSGY